MDYFKYQESKPMSKIWSLFSDLKDITPEQLDLLYGESDFSHTLEIVRSALNGNIPLTDEAIDSFNLFAYERKCRDTDKKGKFNDIKDTVNIVITDNSDDEIKVGYGDISDRKLKSIDDSLDEIMNNAEFESSIKELYKIRSKYIVEKGVDVVSVLLNSLKGIPDAIAEIKEFIKNDEIIKDIVVSLCENSSGDLIKRLEACL